LANWCQLDLCANVCYTYDIKTDICKWKRTVAACSKFCFEYFSLFGNIFFSLRVIEQHTHHVQDIWHDGLHTNESCNSIGQMGWRLPLLQGGPKSK